MKSKFKVGDVVMIGSQIHGGGFCEKGVKFIIGKITNEESTTDVAVLWDTIRPSRPGIWESNVFLVSNDSNKKTLIEKMNITFKKFVNTDLQTQIKAGFRTESLALTSIGQAVALELLVSESAGADYAKLFTAEAQKVVAEQEASK